MAVYSQKAAIFSEYYYEIGGVSFAFPFIVEIRECFGLNMALFVFGR